MSTGPLSVRTADGQVLDLDISFQYKYTFFLCRFWVSSFLNSYFPRLTKEKLYNMYVTYGQKYHDFIVSAVRSLLRHEAAKFSSFDFFVNRIDIEVQYQYCDSKV
jgi:hypothetical protein